MSVGTRTQGRRGSRQPQPRNDAYTWMLILALAAQVIAGTLLALDYFRYPSEKPGKLPEVVKPSPTPPAPAPAQ